MNDPLLLWLAVSGFFITAGTIIVRITMSINNSTAKLTELINNNNKDLEARFNDQSKDLEDRFNNQNLTLRREFGETLKALKDHVAKYEDKLYKVELYIRDKYVEYHTFSTSIDELKSSLKDLATKLDRVIERYRISDNEKV